MVKPKLTFFKMQIESFWTHATEANKTTFRIAPETFDPINVSATFGKFVPAVIDTQVLAVANVDQTVITTPAVRIDDTIKFNFTAYNRL